MGKRQSKFTKVDDFTNEEIQIKKDIERIKNKIIDTNIELKHILMIIESQKLEVIELLQSNLDVFIKKKKCKERILFRISVCQLVINRMITNYKKNKTVD